MRVQIVEYLTEYGQLRDYAEQNHVGVEINIPQNEGSISVIVQIKVLSVFMH